MKGEVLRALRQREYISGEELGARLGVSRTAIWKYIRELRGEGYRINSSTGKGYSLISAPDNPLPEEIKDGLRTQFLGHQIVYRREVGSTQDTARPLAFQNANEGTIVIAERQSEGRGRIGRVWTSLPGSIAFSIILRPAVLPSEAPRFPLIAGVAVARAIEKLTNLNPRLKWPNDVIVGGKKVGGILTEMSAEMDRINHIIIGIGINVNAERASFPKELAGIATSLRAECGKEVSRVRLVQGILVELESLYEDFKSSGFEPIRQRWKALSNTIGAWVSISSEKERIDGEAVDIDQDGALLLRKADGSLERIIAGDVSLR